MVIFDDTTAKRMTLIVIWIFVLFHYVYADIGMLAHVLSRPHLLELFQSGRYGGAQMTDAFMLAAAVFMEIPIAMILLSWVLPASAARIVNIAGGVILTGVIGAIFVVTARVRALAFYNLFQAIEIIATSAITVLALRWRVATDRGDQAKRT